MFAKIKKQKSIIAFLTLFLLVLSLGLTRETLGKFSQSFTAKDSALAAKFDVTITAPEDFTSDQGKNILEHYFLSDTETKSLTFQVYNGGESDVICTPHISNDVNYQVLVSGEEQSKFIVKRKKAVKFQMLIAADGLDVEIKNADLFVDVRQVDAE